MSRYGFDLEGLWQSTGKRFMQLIAFGENLGAEVNDLQNAAGESDSGYGVHGEERGFE
jgi:hypothetical protein